MGCSYVSGNILMSTFTEDNVAVLEAPRAGFSGDKQIGIWLMCGFCND